MEIYGFILKIRNINGVNDWPYCFSMDTDLDDHEIGASILISYWI